MEKITEKYNGIKICKFISFIKNENVVLKYTAGLQEMCKNLLQQ